MAVWPFGKTRLHKPHDPCHSSAIGRKLTSSISGVAASLRSSREPFHSARLGSTCDHVVSYTCLHSPASVSLLALCVYSCGKVFMLSTANTEMSFSLLDATSNFQVKENGRQEVQEKFVLFFCAYPARNISSGEPDIYSNGQPALGILGRPCIRRRHKPIGFKQLNSFVISSTCITFRKC